jgi:DNA-directed RNA polymerase sigma subunit (sigma70/sigma32)
MAHERHLNIYEITGGTCRKLPGRCPYTVCRFNLTSEHRDNRGAKPAELHRPVVREACALEAAELGGMTLMEIATRLSLTSERVRQIESGALAKIRLRLGRTRSECENCA